MIFSVLGRDPTGDSKTFSQWSPKITGKQTAMSKHSSLSKIIVYENNFMFGEVTPTWVTILKSCGIQMVEKHWVQWAHFLRAVPPLWVVVSGGSSVDWPAQLNVSFTGKPEFLVSDQECSFNGFLLLLLSFLLLQQCVQYKHEMGNDGRVW